METSAYASAAVAGNRLVIQAHDEIYQVDLTSTDLVPRLVLKNDALRGDVAVDRDHIWTMALDATNSDLVGLLRVDPDTGATTTVTTMDGHLRGAAMQSVGGYLYMAMADSFWNNKDLVRVSKTSGSFRRIATGFRGIDSIKSDGTSLWVGDGGLKRIDQP